LQFFSRYSYIWKFPDQQETAYNEFVKPGNLISLRLVAFITLFGMSLFLAIDFFRELDVNYQLIFRTRAMALIVATVIMIISFQKSTSVRAIHLCIVVIGLANLGVTLMTATFAKMPAYYLTNLVFLILVLIITASGLNFRHALLLNILMLGIFLFYSQYINRNPFYFSQYPHLFATFFYLHMVGIVLERRRRLNFLQFSDLAEQKRLVEDLNQQKNKIISILSHDVASPLNSLSGLLHLLAKGQVDEKEFRPFLNQIGDQLKNVSGLLHGLVRWSRSQMEGFVTEKKSVDLSAHLEGHIKLFRPLAAEKNLTLKLKTESPLIIFADEEMIRIAIRSLISNAIKFGKKGTEILIESFVNSDNRVVVRISNEGIPIPENLRDKLFTYQMPSTEGTGGERGTGLGLAMAAFFVRFNEGEILLESSSNDGHTVFRIELPIGENHF